MWKSCCYTHQGKIRQVNEDSVLDLASEKLWLVADGMGGHSSGDYASQLVSSTLSHYESSPHSGICKARLVDALNDCNTHLIEKAERENADVIGCTVATLQAREDSVVCSWSGDSRIYRLRCGQLSLLSRDHSQLSAVEDRDQLRFPSIPMEASQMLTSAIGGDQYLSLEHCWYQLCAGDTFLLCTDGLNKELSDDEIRTALAKHTDGDAALQVLATMYQERGARDNVGLVWASHGQP